MDAITTVITKARFLQALERNGGGVSAACRQVGAGRNLVYQWRKEDKEFAAAWDEALIAKDEKLEVTAYLRAVEGVKKPVIHKGEFSEYIDEHGNRQVLTVTEYDNTLLWNMLKASNPAKYRDTAAVQVNLGDELVQKLTAGRARVNKQR